MFVKCQSSFCEYMIQMYKKNNKNGKFYGREELYFTELLYEQKRKARDRKENFTTAPPQSRFVTVSVFVGISVDVPFRQGIRNGLRVCAMPFDPLARPVRTTFHPTRLFPHSKDDQLTREWRRTLRNS